MARLALEIEVGRPRSRPHLRVAAELGTRTVTPSPEFLPVLKQRWEVVVNKGAGSLETSKLKTYTHGGTTPPGGTTHGSATSYAGGDIFPLEILRRAQGTEFSTT